MGIKDTSIFVNWQDYATGDAGGPVPNGFQTRVAVEKVDRTRTGSYLPKWRQVIEAGGNATTPLTATYRSVPEATPQYLSITYDRIPGEHHSAKGWGYCTARFNANVWGTWSSFVDNADARASNKWINAIRQAKVQVSGPTFVGELRETLRMLHKPANGLQSLVDQYLREVTKRYNSLGRPMWAKPIKRSSRGRKGLDANSLRSWEHALAELWLEFSFGWTPLMMDIQDAMKAYASLFDKPRIVHVSGGGKDFYTAGWQAGTGGVFADVGSFMNYKTVTHKEQTSLVRYKGAYRAQAVTTASEQWARFGFTPSEFIPTAWELLPWSFLIDYFVSIGDVLEAVVTDTSDVIWCNKTVVHIVDMVWSDLPDTGFISGFVPYTYSLSPGTLVKRTRSITRSVGSIPTPGLVVRWKQGLWRVTNMLALFQQVSSSGNHQVRTGRNYRL